MTSSMTRGRGAAIAAGTLLLLGVTAPAWAGLTTNTLGCTGTAVIIGSGDSTGTDAAITEKSTEITVPRQGTITYQGTATTVPHNGQGQVSINLGLFSVPVSSWGPSPNDQNAKTAKGSISLPAALAWVPPGTYEVTGYHRATEGECAGSLLITIPGGLLSTPVGIAATALTLLTAVGTAMAGIRRPGLATRRGHPVLGVFSGLLFGLGLALVLQMTNIWPIGSGSLLLLPVIGLVGGLLLGIFGPFGSAPVAVAAPPPAPVA